MKSGNNPIPKKTEPTPPKGIRLRLFGAPIHIRASGRAYSPRQTPNIAPKTQNVSRGSCLREPVCLSGLPDCGSQYARRGFPTAGANMPVGASRLREPICLSGASRLREPVCLSGLPDGFPTHARRRLLRTDYRFMRTFPLVTAAISSGAAIHTSPSMECLMALAAQAKSICAAGSSSVTTRSAISVDSV